jgi:hypothetical protein
VLAASLAATQWVHPACGYIIWVGTSIWAGWDAHQIGLSKYKLNVATSPATTFLGCLLLWIVIFPWYLVNKGKIARGVALPKTA